MRLSDLQVFLAIEKSGSLSAAAKECHLSQPAVSAILVSLERELGCRLIQRRAGQRSVLRLTREGRELYVFAQQTCAQYAALRCRLGAPPNPTGAVLAAGRTNSLCVAPRIAALFRKENPSVLLTVNAFSETDACLRRMEDGACDVVIGSFPPQEPLFERMKLADDDYVLVCPPTRPYVGEISVGALRRLPLVLRERDCAFCRQFEQALEAHGVSMEELTIVLEVYGNGALERAVARGEGYGFLPRSAFHASRERESGVRAARVRGLSLPRKLYAVRRADAAPTADAALLWEFLRLHNWNTLL